MYIAIFDLQEDENRVDRRFSTRKVPEDIEIAKKDHAKAVELEKLSAELLHTWNMLHQIWRQFIDEFNRSCKKGTGQDTYGWLKQREVRYNTDLPRSAQYYIARDNETIPPNVFSVTVKFFNEYIFMLNKSKTLLIKEKGLLKKEKARIQSE